MRFKSEVRSKDAIRAFCAHPGFQELRAARSLVLDDKDEDEDEDAADEFAPPRLSYDADQTAPQALLVKSIKEPPAVAVSSTL